MKQLTLNGKTINCPDTWEDVTLSQFQQFETLQQSEDFEMELVTLMTGQSKEEWSKSTDIKTWQEVCVNLQFLSKLWDTDEIVSKIKEVSLKGQKYKLSDLGNESIGQYRDILTLYNKFCEVEGRLFDLEAQEIYLKMIAIYFQPSKEYDYVKAMETKDEIKEMSILHIIALGNFFLQKYAGLSYGMMNALQQGQEIIKNGKHLK